MEKPVYLLLENGDYFEGKSFGAPLREVTGEVVFTTGMTGYLETITDPSYFGQIVVQTFPLIGNYGVIPQDFENEEVYLSAYIVKEWCQEPSNFRCSGDLDTFFKERNIPGVYGIDTRKLAKTIRESGSMNGWLTEVKPPYDAKKLEEVKNFHITKAVETVTPKKCEIKPADEKEEFQIVLWDFGAKENIIRELTRRGCRVADLPAGTTAEEILAMNPDGIMLSNGPGNPEDNPEIIEEIRKITKAGKPMFGICLGHQLLGYFAGAEVSRAPYVMHGKSSDIIHDGAGLFSGLPNPMTVGRYHSLVVQSKEDEPNPRFTVTSRGPEGEVMALRYNDRPWVGIQFHPESILTPNGLQLLGNFPDNVVPSGQKEKRISRILDALAAGQDLTADMAAAGFADIMDGRMTPAQAGCFLMGLRMKGETPLEMAHAVGIALGRANRVEGLEGDCIDVVGTGGDGRNSFNCSTATALTLAGMGYRVVKHGNRAVSSSCGSADALEGLGFPLDVAPEDVRRLLDERNFAFLFAPNFHPSFRNVGPIRRELGIRTLFNLLGPLINPARPTHILLGVARPELVELLAETLRQSHIRKAAVVYGAGGYDEVTPLGPTKMMIIHNGRLTPMSLDPLDYGIQPCNPEELAVHSKSEAVDVLKNILAGKGPRAMMDMVILNVGVAMFLLEEHMDLSVCMAKAREAVCAGIGRRTLHAA